MQQLVAVLGRVTTLRSVWLEAWLSAEQGRFALWVPVCIGAGVLWYFDLRVEPAGWVGLAVVVPALLAAWLSRWWVVPRAIFLSLGAVALGFAAAQLATAMAPAIDPLPTHAAKVSGTVRGLELLPGGRRITLDEVTLQEAEAPLHRRLHIRLRKDDGTAVTSGDRIEVRALLRPAAPPSYPGAWDMQRDAFYADLGGSGYALAPIVLRDHGPLSAMLWMLRLRETINQRIELVLSGSSAGLAEALLSGLMTNIPAPDMAAFRNSGLAHLLSVSGLHIAIVMGIGLVMVRTLLAAWPYAALHWPCKHISVLAALASGAFYMVLTGSQVPMVRSFAMSGLVAFAVLAGRRAISMRSLAIAATVLILVEPDALVGASLQMSFAAVLALLAGHEVLGGKLRALSRSGGWLGVAAAYVLGLMLTSMLAGTATLPFGAYHFGRVQFYFALSNLIAVPLTGVMVMPAGMLALALMPLGIERPALVVMGWGNELVLWIARFAAAQPGATIMMPHMPPWGLVVVAFGMIWLAVWRSRIRMIGAAVIALGLTSPMSVRPPDLLISAEARLIGARTPGGVYLQQISGASKFTRDAWLHYWAVNDARAFPVEGSMADGVISCAKEVCTVRPAGGGKGALLIRGATRPDGCAATAVIVSAEPARGLCPRPWPALVDRFTVWRYGATAVWLDGAHARVLTDRSYRGDRPWVPPLPVPRSQQPPALPPARVDAALPVAEALSE